MRRKRRLYAAVLVLLLLLAAGCSIKSKEQYQAEILDGDLQASIEIRCDTILANGGSVREEIKKLVPEDGVLVEKTTVGLPEEATARDLLQKAAKVSDLVVNISGTKSGAYVVSIGGIGEFDCGELSGWMFYVNGERPSVGCGAYRLQEGDEVQFLYTCDLGDDLE